VRKKAICEEEGCSRRRRRFVKEEGDYVAACSGRKKGRSWGVKRGAEVGDGGIALSWLLLRLAGLTWYTAEGRKDGWTVSLICADDVETSC
jgi:hypothetical protein